LKFVSRTIPQSGGYNAQQLAAEVFPKLALGFIPVIQDNIRFLRDNIKSQMIVKLPMFLKKLTIYA
jgi:hypothetical protein